MMNTTIGRLALVAVAGLLISTTPPATAKTQSEAAAEQSANAGKPLALVKSKKVGTQKASRSRKAKEAAVRAAKKQAALDARRAKAKAAAAREKAIPTIVANANALMTAPDTRGSAAMSGAVPLEAAAADQLTELSQSLTSPPAEDDTRRAAMQLAQIEQTQTISSVAAPAAPPPPVVLKPVRSVMQITAMPSGDPWEQSSMIGKLFIALGGVLTLASAARMLIA